MSHEELKAKIENLYFIYNTPVNALLAVLELHKPLEGTSTCHQFCETNDDFNCPTIQAIAKEIE